MTITMKKDALYRVYLIVRVFKRNGPCLEFGCTAYPEEIAIKSLSVKDPESSEDRIAYKGPNFMELDENLQKPFHKVSKGCSYSYSFNGLCSSEKSCKEWNSAQKEEPLKFRVSEASEVSETEKGKIGVLAKMVPQIPTLQE
ncbi:unnamed protein product [Fraxinus pennsylvanica]|uniref:Uncharacterized protein n=1 Tax=Fraxinus pennsylvanica TaxID=56036 RepID=A0AAD1YPU4_9LAMI|nr:unnamed protein product [Fraxinus pennsylvanica]